ncbi:hypothetical protein DFH11DRAFT_1516175 [Phellopilus nigrolimitatus]|nr:hypothetical protein DFH11DRAFT_1516175 [Phellopilus nigrolimitatus]
MHITATKTHARKGSSQIYGFRGACALYPPVYPYSSLLTLVCSHCFLSSNPTNQHNQTPELDTDVHLDTSWCLVCDCLIMPKRYTVPDLPPLPQKDAPVTSNLTISVKGAMRGKRGRVYGLLRGTGRVRPGGGLRPNVPNKAKSRQRAAQEPVVPELPAAPHRTRTVIDRSQTPLYCSEACRKKDLESSWPVPMPSARGILERDSSSDGLKSAESAHLATKTKYYRKEKRVSLGAHPAQLNPAYVSPPLPSPILPPVPSNEPNLWDFLALDLDATTLRPAHSESDTSSCATGTSCTTSASAEERSAGEERSDGLPNLYTDPAPPPLPPLPLHPHRPSAPALAPPTSDPTTQDVSLLPGGILMTARLLVEIFRSGAADGEQAKEERRLREEQAKKEEERRRAWDLTGEAEREARANRRAGKVEKPKPAVRFDPARWRETVYSFATRDHSAPVGVISTHRRSSTGPASDSQTNADNTAKVRRPLVRAPAAPTHAQSALELYAWDPLVVHAPSSSSTGPAPRKKSNVSFATSYSPALGRVTSTSASKSASTKSASTSVSDDAHSGTSALTLPGVDPALYAGKRRAAPRRVLAKGVEGKLLVPDVLLRSTVSARRSKRSAGELESVREEGGEGEAEGTWHRPAEEMSEDGTGISAPERRRMNMTGMLHFLLFTSVNDTDTATIRIVACNWTYENVEGPLYDAMPAVPIKQTRYEEIFFPDPLPAISTSLRTSLSTASTSAVQESTQESSADEKPYIETSALHARDIELARRAIREVGSRRGEHRGRTGLWVEKEWEVTAIPERKKLFLFGSGTGRTQ